VETPPAGREMLTHTPSIYYINTV